MTHYTIAEAGIPGALGGALASLQGVSLLDPGTALQYGFNIGVGYIATLLLKIAFDGLRRAWRRRLRQKGGSL